MNAFESPTQNSAGAAAPLHEALRRAFVRHAKERALHFNGRDWSYANLDRITDTLASALQERGIQSGDRVAFLLPNCPELVFIDLACFKIGAVAVALNTRLTGAELAYILNHCQARLCVAHADLYAELASVRSDLPHIESCYLIGSTTSPGEAIPFATLLGGAYRAPVTPSLSTDAAAAILYTSGTTARPKGVTHTHGSLGSTVRNFTNAAAMRNGDNVLGMLSMSHVFGFTLQMLAPLSVGATVVIAASFDPVRILNLVAQQRVSHLYGLPVMFDALTRDTTVGTMDKTSLRYCLAGGDAVSPALNNAMRSVLGLELHEGCGMTEVIPYALNRPGIENRIGSIGPASVGMQVRLVDARGNDVAPGETGEIIVKSDALMAGYWNDPEATAATIRNRWMHTGDVGRCDAEGYYWFVGRRKEIIVRGGSNISPLEVESVLSLHPAVRAVAVVGAPHETLGESVTAFVVLKDGAAASAEDLKRFALLRLAAYKVPERIAFLPDLPRGLTGKVHRKTLKELAATPPSANA